jgi:glycosyltransferase involved in cell wall biosynthesis
MSRRHLAFFLPSLAGGGSESVSLLLAEGFLRRNYQVDLVVGRKSGELLNRIPAGVRLVDLGTSRTLLACPALGRYLKQQAPAAIVSVLNHANIVALVAARLAAVRTPVFVRVGFPISRNLDRGLRERVAVHLAGRAYRWASRVIAVSDAVAADLKTQLNLPDDRIVTIYNPVVRPELRDLADEPVDHQWLSKQDVPVIIGVGRLTRMKDFQLLVKAFARVRREINCRLIILGEGPERSNLENLVREFGLQHSVDLPGFVTNPHAYVSRASLFVLSSRGEGLPNALAEAVALRVPAIATDCLAGPREILQDGLIGPLVPVGDETAMVSAMTRVLRGYDYQLATDEDLLPFTLQNCIDRYEDLIFGSATQG